MSDEELVEPKPAWLDEDDCIEISKALAIQNRKLPGKGASIKSTKYSNLLKHKFQAISGQPKWVQQKPKDDKEIDNAILKTCGFIDKKIKSKLAPTVLEMKKLNEINCHIYGEGPIISCIDFHPTSSAVLVAGNGGVVTLYSVDGIKNNKLHSLGFQKFPMFGARFVSGGNEAILGSNLPYIYSYNVITSNPIKYNLPKGLTQCKKFTTNSNLDQFAVAGKWGEVHLLSVASKESVAVLKQHDEATALAFNPQGSLLFGHSTSGEVTVWDMNTRKVRHTFYDEGCVQGTTIQASEQFVATGSAQGVVNLYRIDEVLNTKTPKPMKTLLNLTTSISNLTFNPSAEILAFSSLHIPNSVKLLHIGSGTVFNNFPIFKAKYGHVYTMEFSPNSGYFAFGNKQSIVSLYRLRHFKNY